jgi:GDP-mannose 6-dehydrogenase
MKISVFGIGYVGAVASACLADSGHQVIAVDPSTVKVNCINNGKSPIIENGLDELIAKGLENGNLTATTDFKQAVRDTEISLICVGTPSKDNGGLDLKYIEETCRQIGTVLKEKEEFHTVVIRSTVLPGTLMEVVKPILEEASGKVAGKDFGLGNNPEFLREGTAIEDYYNPTQIVVGAMDEKTANIIMSLYDGIDSNRTIAEPSVAEGVKYVSNSWRANKITFANEIGNILKHHGVDSHKVMKIIFQDSKINMGPSFLLPGFAFGGSCLPKDVRAIRASANDKGIPTPLFDSLLTANHGQILHAMDMIRKTGKRNVGLLGLSFKPNTDDLRESPLVTLAEMLLSEGYTLKIYDPCVYRARHMDGANKEYIEKGIPHISRCLVAHADDVIAESDVFVIGNNSKEFGVVLNSIPADTPVVDLVRTGHEIEKRPSYAGICW